MYIPLSFTNIDGEYPNIMSTPDYWTLVADFFGDFPKEWESAATKMVPISMIHTPGGDINPTYMYGTSMR